MKSLFSLRHLVSGCLLAALLAAVSTGNPNSRLLQTARGLSQTPLLALQLPFGGRLLQKARSKKKARPSAAKQSRPSKSQPSSSESQSQLQSTSESRRLLLTISVETYLDPMIPVLQNLSRTALEIRGHLVNGSQSKNVEAVAIGNQIGNARLPVPLTAPTTANVSAAISSLLQDVRPEDQVLIILIGHGFGIPAADDSGESSSFFCLADTPKTAFKSREVAETSAMSIDKLIEQLRDCPAEQKILIVDACQDQAESFPMQLQPRLQAHGDVWLVTSCSPGQKAQVRPHWKHRAMVPVFSSWFSEAIRRDTAFDEDGDGQVALTEAFNFARRKTCQQIDDALEISGYDLQANQQLRQIPRICIGRGFIPLVQIPTVLPQKGIVSTNEQEERRLTAEAMARYAGILLNDAEGLFQEKLHKPESESVSATTEIPDNADRLLAGYALNHYLATAQQMSPDTREATLVMARQHRSAGKYLEAMVHYRKVGLNSMTVFANGTIPPASLFYGEDAQRFTSRKQNRNIGSLDNQAIAEQAFPGINTANILGLISSIPTFHVHQDADGKPTSFVVAEQRISASTAVQVTEVRAGSDTGELWLQVDSLDGEELKSAEPVWVRGSDVHWCREASQMYVEGSDLTKDVSVIIASQQRNAVLATLTPSFDAEIAKLREAQRKLDRLIRILGSIPYTGSAAGWLSYAKSWVAFAENIRDSRLRDKYVSYETRRLYQKASSKADLIEEFQQKTEQLLKEREAGDPATVRRVTIQGSPWRE